MKTLKTLIKLGQKELDKLLINKKTLLIQKEQILNQIRSEIIGRQEEQAKFANSEYSFFLEKFMQNSLSNQKKLESKFISIEHQIIEIEENITKAFAEVKRFEILMQKKQLELYNKAKIAESKNLDEITIMKAARESQINTGSKD